MRASRGIYNGGNQFISNDEIDQSNHYCGKHFGQFQVDIYGYTFYKEVTCLSRLVENVKGEGGGRKGIRVPPPINKFASAPIIQVGALVCFNFHRLWIRGKGALKNKNLMTRSFSHNQFGPCQCCRTILFHSYI